MEEPTIASFNSWTTLFLVVSLFGLCLAGLLAAKTETRKNNWPIILLVTGFSLIMIQYVFIWTGYRLVYPYVYFFEAAWYLSFGPLLYTYLSRFYKKDFKIHIGHFLPAIIALCLSVVFYYPTTGFTNFEPLSGNPFLQLTRQIRFPWISNISLTIYFFMSVDFVRNFEKELAQKETNQLRQTWTNYILRFYGLFLIALISYYVLVPFPFFNSLWDYAISLCMSAGIYGLGFLVFKEREIFDGSLLAGIFLPDSEKPGLTEKTKKELFEKLRTHMEGEKPYLNSEIRLVHLADQLGFSSHLLSHIINDRTNRNFNQFINEYRLEEASRLLIQSQLPIKEICYGVGFNNKTTFYTAFKNQFGTTPVGYRKRQLADILN
ncbi:MAG: AraC family transcriptional regulator [Bacteroidetes bacterium]|nr:AraC family transcriptional regulator [Bacteroidota bacterium]